MTILIFGLMLVERSADSARTRDSKKIVHFWTGGFESAHAGVAVQGKRKSQVLWNPRFPCDLFGG
jgi:hypothetical protein